MVDPTSLTEVVRIEVLDIRIDGRIVIRIRSQLGSSLLGIRRGTLRILAVVSEELGEMRPVTLCPELNLDVTSRLLLEHIHVCGINRTRIVVALRDDDIVSAIVKTYRNLYLLDRRAIARIGGATDNLDSIDFMSRAKVNNEPLIRTVAGIERLRVPVCRGIPVNDFVESGTLIPNRRIPGERHP